MVPAFAALAVGAALFSLNLMPGGDVKLLSAAILWTGLDVLPSFLIWVGVAGLIITLLFVTARRGLEALVIQLQASFRLSSFVPLSLAERRGYVPYGVVIAAASIAVVERIPLFG
jgi:prepilin peptidase CpaA